MRVLQGTKVIETAAGWRDQIDQQRVVIDVGAGDGRFAYDSARRDSDALYVALDPDAATLADYAYRASRKPARGGASNAVFVVAAVEDLPPELTGIAAVVRVNFPWGSLLRGLVLPEAPVLQAIAGLGAQHSKFEIVFSYNPVHDLAGLGGEDLPPLDEGYIDSLLAPAYAEAGLEIETRRRMSTEEALTLPSSWGRRLLHGRHRDVFWLEGPIRGSER